MVGFFVAWHLLILHIWVWLNWTPSLGPDGPKVGRMPCDVQIRLQNLTHCKFCHLFNSFQTQKKFSASWEHHLLTL